MIFTGGVTVDELNYDKPDEYAHRVAAGDLEEHLVQPPWRRFEGFVRVFAYSALFFGLALIALIVYSMLFGYR